MQQSTIHGKYDRKTAYLLWSTHVGIGEYMEMGYCLDDAQMMTTDESQLMTSCGSRTK